MGLNYLLFVVIKNSVLFTYSKKIIIERVKNERQGVKNKKYYNYKLEYKKVYSNKVPE